MKYKVKQTKALETNELKYEIDSAIEKVKLSTNEQFLKLVKEFLSMIETYNVWNKE
jgi:hypothetical protein